LLNRGFCKSSFIVDSLPFVVVRTNVCVLINLSSITITKPIQSLMLASSSAEQSFLKSMPNVLSGLVCRRRKHRHQIEADSIALDLPAASSLQHLASSWPYALPETLLAGVLEFAGPSAWFSAACANKEWHQTLWQSSTLWSSALYSLGEEPGRVEQDVSRQRDRTRKCWFGITSFIMQGPLPGIGCNFVLMEEASRAIKGLRKTDTAEEIDQTFQRCIALLRAFQISDTLARNEAIKLEALISAREDLFNVEERKKATDALAEATELAELLDDALQMQDSELIDVDSLDEDGMEALVASDGGWCCEEEQEESVADGSAASEEALDRLLSLLRDAVMVSQK